MPGRDNWPSKKATRWVGIQAEEHFTSLYYPSFVVSPYVHLYMHARLWPAAAGAAALWRRVAGRGARRHCRQLPEPPGRAAAPTSVWWGRGPALPGPSGGTPTHAALGSQKQLVLTSFDLAPLDRYVPHPSSPFLALPGAPALSPAAQLAELPGPTTSANSPAKTYTHTPSLKSDPPQAPCGRRASPPPRPGGAAPAALSVRGVGGRGGGCGA